MQSPTSEHGECGGWSGGHDAARLPARTSHPLQPSKAFFPFLAIHLYGRDRHRGQPLSVGCSAPLPLAIWCTFCLFVERGTGDGDGGRAHGDFLQLNTSVAWLWYIETLPDPSIFFLMEV